MTIDIEMIKARAAYCHPDAEGSYGLLARPESDRAELRWNSTAALDAIVDRAELLSPLHALTARKGELDDERWRIERPTAGKWRVSLQPEMRHNVDGKAVLSAVAVLIEGRIWIRLRRCGPILLAASMFHGAKWQRVEPVADPFVAREG